MHILVTRPEDDAAATKTQLEALGHHVSLAPLLKVELLADSIRLTGAEALIATSRNALRALARSSVAADANALPIAVVGKASAALAQELGFRDVISGEGGARDLLPLIVSRLSGMDVLYLTGEDVAFDLGSALQTRGARVRRQIVYRTQAADALPASVVVDIAGGKLDAVLSMSPLSASLFARLALAHGVAKQAADLVHVCLSPAVAEALCPLAPRQVLIAAKPSTEEVLALVGEMASNRR